MSRTNESVEVLVHGPGELVLGLADRSGRMLLLRRIAFSGHEKLVARSHLPLKVATVGGTVEVSPVVVSQSRGQVIHLGGGDAATFIQKRCRGMRADPADVYRAARETAKGMSDGNGLRLPTRPGGLPSSMRAKRGVRTGRKKS